MMGSELHLHVVEENGDELVVRVPTISLSNEQYKGLVYDGVIHITFEGRVMHFFDAQTKRNLLVD